MKKVIVTSGWGAGYPEGGGLQWLNLHYLAGLRALGVEAFWLDVTGAGEERIRQFRQRCERFEFECAVLRKGRPADRPVVALCNDCDLLINLCGALKDDELLRRIRRRAYFDLDPGFTQIWAKQWDMGLSKHNLFFTVGQNIQEKPWQTFLPPVALEYWPAQTAPPARPFTTIGQWRGQEAILDGEYFGPKREEFLRFRELPGKTAQPIELALLIHESETEDLAAMNQWKIVDPHQVAGGLDEFRRYIQESRGEFSVAKHGYVKSRSGWVSDRTACYLASGRPVLVQDTGAGVPGLMTFSTLEEAVAGLAKINADYAGHCAAARKLAEQKFAAPVVLQSILERAGVL